MREHAPPLASDHSVPTWGLLSAIDAHGPRWPAAIDGWSVDAVGDAISRETFAGNLALPL